jgi:DNA-binding NarL/FixJ family response regulator
LQYSYKVTRISLIVLPHLELYPKKMTMALSGSKKERAAVTLKVLVVDDSAIVRERLISMLSELADVEVVGQAQDAHEAIEAISKLKPDVVILDIRMRRGSGIEVLETIKKDTPSTTVIMLTNYPYPQYRKKCMDAGANFFFDKSTEFEKIAEVLGQLIHHPELKPPPP